MKRWPTIMTMSSDTNNDSIYVYDTNVMLVGRMWFVRDSTEYEITCVIEI